MHDICKNDFVQPLDEIVGTVTWYHSQGQVPTPTFVVSQTVGHQMTGVITVAILAVYNHLFMGTS